jgi:hypothetical protein
VKRELVCLTVGRLIWLIACVVAAGLTIETSHAYPDLRPLPILVYSLLATMLGMRLKVFGWSSPKKVKA